MATIAQSLALHDGFSPVLKTIQKQMIKTIEIFDKMENRLNQELDVRIGMSLQQEQFEAVKNQLETFNNEVYTPMVQPKMIPGAQMPDIQTISTMPGEVSKVIQTAEIAASVQGYERLNRALEEVVITQKRVSAMSGVADVISPRALNRVENISHAMNQLTQRIGVVTNRQASLNTTMSRADLQRANKSVEVLNSMLTRASSSQNALNRAMESGDLKAIHQQTRRLNQLIRKATSETNKLTRQQDRYTQSLTKGDNVMRRMAKGLTGMLGVYGMMRTGKGILAGALNLDQMERTLGARLGDMDVGSALFEKLKEQAKGSAFSLEELVGNTNSFMAATTDMKQLDGLNAVAEKLALFDTTGQGLAGAGFSIKEALSGDIVSLAERFNMSKSLIRGLGIDQLGKSGDIDGFIEQFNKLLDMQNMGDEAYQEMLKAPKTQLNMLKSNFQTAFSEASLVAISALQPLIERMNSFLESEGLNTFLGYLSIGLTSLVNGAIWAWDALTNLYNTLAPFTPVIVGLVAAFLVYKGTMMAIAAVQGLIATITAIHTALTLGQTAATFGQTVAQHGLNAALLACPLTWIVLAIVAVVAALIYLWNTNDKFAAALMRAWNWILNGLDQMSIGFMTGFYSILNFIGSFKVGALNLLQGFINGAIDMINGFIKTLNNIPGVSIETIGQVSFATEAALKEEALAQERTAKVEDMKMKAVDKAQQREQKVLDMLQKREDKRNNPNTKDKDWKNTLDGFKGQQAAIPNQEDMNVKKVKEPVKVLNDSFEYLKDFAEQNIFKDLQRLSADMHITYDKKVQEEGEMFIAKNDAELMRQNAKSETVINEYYLEYKSNVNNTVHQSQDIDEIYTLLEERTQEEIETSASFLAGEV